MRRRYRWYRSSCTPGKANRQRPAMLGGSQPTPSVAPGDVTSLLRCRRYTPVYRRLQSRLFIQLFIFTLCCTARIIRGTRFVSVLHTHFPVYAPSKTSGILNDDSQLPDLMCAAIVCRNSKLKDAPCPRQTHSAVKSHSGCSSKMCRTMRCSCSGRMGVWRPGTWEQNESRDT